MNKAIQELPTYIQEKVSAAQVPIKYTAAIKALAECRNIDEAKYFADKSDALVAWAKIYQHDEAAVEAKRLKLHAYRRMGILAIAIQPRVPSGGGDGPEAILRRAGLTKQNARAAAMTAEVPTKRFKQEVESARPHAPHFFTNKPVNGSDGWLIVSGNGNRYGGDMARFRTFCRKQDPKEIARMLTASEAKIAREIITDIIEWADTFDQYLPKE